MHMSLPSVSVVVPAFNAQQTIAHTIQSVLSQDYSGEIELLVVDDGSTDETPRIVRSFQGVKCIQQVNAGPAAARNRGAADSRGEIIIFTDSDCVAHNDWIRKIVDGFTIEKVGAVCGGYGIANSNNILARCIHSEVLYRHRVLMSSFPRAFGSYNVGIKREVFFEVGGFNEHYRRASGEDNDLSYKILKSGRRIYFNKTALVDHHHTTVIKKYLKEQWRHGFWRAKMYADHPSMARGDDYTFWKDMLEVPLVCFSVIGMVLWGIGFLTFKNFILLSFVPFFVLELYFANLFCDAIPMKFYFSFVMFFRSFARAFGLSTGIIVFLTKKVLKKLNKILNANVAMLS
jgi:glycosyltransferase involved in cell wall biosynthesis